MEMEHINENTIRVIIDDADLKERGFSMLDLLGNRRKIESFFYSILEEVDLDDTFRDNDMITFQVVPNKRGLELYISKDNSDSDHPFDRFQDYHHDTMIDFESIQDDDDFHWIGAQPILEAVGQSMDTEDSLEDIVDGQKETVFEFEDIEHVIMFAQHVKLEKGLSFLHAYQDNYYLTLIQFVDETPEYLLKNEITIAHEFGEKSKMSYVALDEYGKEIMSGNALETLRAYFD